MRDRISILVNMLPKYGEILLGVGCIVLENKEEILENAVAREAIKNYLLEEGVKTKSLAMLCRSEGFQRIVYDYTGKVVNIAAIRDKVDEDKKVNILLADFFTKAIWPILVKRYIDNIYEGLTNIEVSINVKKNVYLTIYEEDNPNILFSELKDFLLCNCIVISSSNIQQNGDLFLKLMLPIPPHKSFEPGNM